jgi:hypothetical protein
MEELAVTKTAESRYHQLSSDRAHFIERADKCAKLTVPTLFQRDVTTASNLKIKDPEQSVGARGVNTLASKMILSLLPMNTSFFKLNMDLILPEGVDQELMQQTLKGLGVIERQTLREIENSGDITVVFEAIKHLIVTGNGLLFVGEKGTRHYDLNKYCVVRTPEGEWTEIVICEEVAPASLSANIKQLLHSSGKLAISDGPEKHLKMYTYVTRQAGRVTWHQEISGIKLDDTTGNVPEEGNPWIPLRFLRVDGEAYGRSYVEMFLGDLNSLEVLTKAVTEGAAAAAKVIFLVRPNGTTNPKVIAQAPNLAVRTGDANDVTVLRMDKSADMSVALEMIGAIERRVAYAFMINSEVMRDAERVTAEEVRFVAQELDDSLGGIYSLLSKEFQLPYVQRRLFLLRKLKNAPKLPPSIKPAIVTGFAALGRGHDADKLLRFIEKVGALLSNPAIAQKLNVDEIIVRLAVADGIDTSGLMVDPAEQAEQQQQGMGMNMMDKLGPEVIRQLGPAVQQQMAMEGGMNVPQP